MSTVYDGHGAERDDVLVRRPGRVRLSAGRDVMPDIGALIPLTEQCLAELEAAVGVGPLM